MLCMALPSHTWASHQRCGPQLETDMSGKEVMIDSLSNTHRDLEEKLAAILEATQEKDGSVAALTAANGLLQGQVDQQRSRIST